MKDLVFVVEDEPHIQELLEYNLLQEGYDVLIFSNGREALDMLRRRTPSIILLDIMLPGQSGIEICKSLKAHKDTESIPVIMLTAKGTESDKVSGLDLGADDYVTKPFSPRELSARVKAVLRRSAKAPKSRLGVGSIVMDLPGHSVVVGNEKISLTLTEFNILKELLKNPGSVLTRAEITNSASGEGVNVTERTIDVHMVALRKKLKEEGFRIETVRGVGYKFSVIEEK